MSNIWELGTYWLKILFLQIWVKFKGFWKTFHLRVFEKLFISYSCILFIKHCALRSFCIKMFYFSKIWFFQIFDQSNLLLDKSKLRLKIWFESAWLNWCSIAAGLIECNFRSIESIFWSIKNRLESFLKHEILTCSSLFQKFQKAFLSHFDRSRFKDKFFCRFPLIFLKGFDHLEPERLLCPFFFGLISFFMHLRENFEPIKIWGFWWFQWFLSKLVNGFLLLVDINMFFMV